MYIFCFTYRFSWNILSWVYLLPFVRTLFSESFNAYDSFLIISESLIVVPMFLLSTSVMLVSLLSSICVGLLAIGFSLIVNCPNWILSSIRLKWHALLCCRWEFLKQNLYSSIPAITRITIVTTLDVVPKIVLILLFFCNCFRWNFFLTSTMLTAFWVLCCSSLISWRNSFSSYCCTLIRSLRCKLRLFCFKMMFSSISIPEI